MMNLYQKRRLTLFAFSVRIFLMGVEEAIIFPSLWQYLQMFHADYWYLGVVVSSYYIVGIASSMLMGHLADGSMNIRFSGFICNLFEIVGNLTYSLHFNMAFPLLGRLVAGFGEGYVTAMWAEVARITTEEERTRYFALLKVSSLLGQCLGPALNLFLKEFDFYIGNWHIDFRTSPGFFMSFMWILVTAIMFVFVYDLRGEMIKEKGYELVSDDVSEEQFSKKEQLVEAYSMNTTGDKHGDMTSSPFIKDDVIKTEEIANDDNSVIPDDSTESSSGSFRETVVDIFTKFHVIVVLFSSFFTFTFHSSLQAIAPLVTERMLYWSEDNVSFLFTLWGVEIVLFAIIIAILSRKVSDRLLLLTAAIFGCLASVGVILLATSTSMSNRAYHSLLVTIVLEGIPITVINTVGRSLVSKHTNADHQGQVQAIVSVLNRLASFTGPLIGSGLFTHQTIFAIILSGSQCLELVLVILAFNKLNVNLSNS